MTRARAPLTRAAMMQGLQRNNEKLRRLLFATMERLPRARTCSFATVLSHARVE